MIAIVSRDDGDEEGSDALWQKILRQSTRRKGNRKNYVIDSFEQRRAITIIL
jgi:hypothetical protein